MDVLYNDHDRKACAWTRELIRANLIPEGTVDERSITDLRGSDLSGYRQVHLFNGIAGWAYALQLAGWNPARPVWCGSCPCQPFSAAGKRQGKADDRHLWPHMFRLIRECRPDTIFGEQVPGAIGFGWLDGICTDLEGEGYAVGACLLGAHSVGAPHIRQRLYWVAVAESQLHRGVEPGPRWRTESANSVPTGRLANTNRPGQRPDDRRVQRQQRDNAGRGSEAYRLANSESGKAGPGDDVCAGEHDARNGSKPGRMEHATSDGRGERRAEPGRGSVTSGCGDGGLDNSSGVGRENRQAPPGSGQRGATQGPGKSNPWTASDLIPCRDGKNRRIPRGASGAESILQPVVDGFPSIVGGVRHPGLCLHPLTAAKIEGRVSLLRGAGNAIVPQVDAAFIMAFLDIEAELMEGAAA